MNNFVCEGDVALAAPRAVTAASISADRSPRLQDLMSWPPALLVAPAGVGGTKTTPVEHKPIVVGFHCWVDRHESTPGWYPTFPYGV